MIIREIAEDGTVTETVVQSAARPAVLSKTTFNKYVANVLGAGDFMAGTDAFQTIMDACAAGSGRVKFCFTQYTAALSFEKSEVDAFTAALVAAAIMTSQQRTAILSNWPEA